MKYYQKTGKIILRTILGIFLLVLISLFLLRSGMFNNFIAQTVSSRVSHSINGQLKIESLDGNVFSHFSLKNVSVYQGDSLVASLDRLALDYAIGPLLKKEIKFHRISIHNFQVFASQGVDSTWNLQHILPPGQERDSSTTSFNWKLSIERFFLDSLSAQLSSKDNHKIPEQIQTGMQLSFLKTPDILSMDIQKIYLYAKSPDLHLRKFSGKFAKDSIGVYWDDLKMQFDKTHLESYGMLNIDSLLKSYGNLTLSPLEITEFQPWIPSLTLYGHPEIRFQMKRKHENRKVILSMREGTQHIALAGFIKPVKRQLRYDMRLTVDSLDGAYWTRRKEFQSFICGNLQLEGEGSGLKSSSLKAAGEFGDLKYSDYELNDLVFEIRKKASALNGFLQTRSSIGNLSVQFDLRDFFSQGYYEIHGNLQEIDLAKLTDNKHYSSDLNFNLDIAGKGFHPDTMQSKVRLNLASSMLMNEPISSMNVHISYDHGDYLIDTFNLQSSFASLNIKGEGDVYENNDLKYLLEIDDIEQISQQIMQQKVLAKGDVKGNVTGSLDSLALKTSFGLYDLQFDSIYATNLHGNVSALFKDSVIYRGRGDFQLDSIVKDSIPVEKLTVKLDYKKDELENMVDLIVHDSLRLELHSFLRGDTDPQIYIKDLSLQDGLNLWNAGSDSTYILLGKESVQVHGFHAQSDSQSINVRGNLAFRGEENLSIQFRNIDLDRFSGLLDPGPDVSGFFSGDIHLTGTAEKPVLRSDFSIENPSVDSLDFQSVHTRVDYSEDKVLFEGSIQASNAMLFHVRGSALHPISLTDTLSLPDDSTPVEGSLLIDQLNPGLFNPFLKSGLKLNGIMRVEASVDSTLGHPDYEGTFTLQNGTMHWQEQGLLYSNISLSSNFSDDLIELDEMMVHSENGYLSAEGKMEMKRMGKKETRNLQLHIAGETFQAINSELVQATLSPDIKLEGTVENPVMSGNIEVNRSQINSDALLGNFSVMTDNPNPPLLVEAIEDTLTTDSTKREERSLQFQDEKNSGFYNHLRGSFDLSIPGNTWVRGEDMNFELQGDLRGIKQGTQLDLFGSLNINRGYIDYYGKKFEFEKGNITFTGGREINPVLDFTIAYEFRDMEKALRTITLNITGRSKTPEFSFLMNDQRIEEREALSYIIFGKSTHQLTEYERTTTEESVKNLAGSLAMNQFSGLIKDALKKSVGLDVVDVSSGKNWQTGSVEIGKYITDNLYMGYQQTFALDKKEKTIKPEKISLEYQILRSLFFQATNQGSNSGFDLIFKKSWK